MTDNLKSTSMASIEGKTGQHSIDVCNEGQGNLDSYVKFLKLNDINSKSEIITGVRYNFVEGSEDSELLRFVEEDSRFVSLDKKARDLWELGLEDSLKIYGERITIYGETITIYGSIE